MADPTEQNPKDKTSFWDRHKSKFTLFWGAMILTVGWFVFSVWLLFFRSNCKTVEGQDICSSNWSTLQLNELGDFFAGTFSGLAFLWVIVAVFMQRDELKLQRQEMGLAREQFNRMADQGEVQTSALQNEQKAKAANLEILNALHKLTEDFSSVHVKFYVQISSRISHTMQNELNNLDGSESHPSSTRHADTQAKYLPVLRNIKPDNMQLSDLASDRNSVIQSCVLAFTEMLGFSEKGKWEKELADHLIPIMKTFLRKYSQDIDKSDLSYRLSNVTRAELAKLDQLLALHRSKQTDPSAQTE
jgi:hypothetical protein